MTPRRDLANEFYLEGSGCAARVYPNEGARVQSLLDVDSGRELLYQRDCGDVPRDEFLTCSTGGWDTLFPNDSPWNGFPDHGVFWGTAFRPRERRPDAVELHATLGRPAVDVVQRLALLPTPRRGLRVVTTLLALAPTSYFLLAHHPMLAVGAGWMVDFAGDVVVADREMHGRFEPGSVAPAERAAAAALPGPGIGLSEVLYVDGPGEAVVRSPDGRQATRVAWDQKALPHLWIVVVSGEAGIDLTLLFEPCTSRPYRLEDAIAARTARSLATGESLTAWCEVESLDT